MFARQNRLGAASAVRAVLAKGRRASSSVSALMAISTPNTPRTTVVVGTKVSKRAVVRNKVKRRLRAILRESGLPQGDSVLVARPGSEKKTYQELTRDVAYMKRKLTE